jgi:carboxylesterase
MSEPARAQPYGVLVLHGLTSSLASVTPVADRLARHGIPSVVPWLRGHGTRPEDLVGVTWHDWYADAVVALDGLLEQCAGAAVVGLSMGGLVALHLAVERPERLRAVVTVAPALRQAHRLAPLVPFVAPFRRYLSVPARGYSDATRAQLAAGYPRLPTSAFLSLVAYARWLEPRLAEVRAPTLVIHSRADRVIHPASATRVHTRLGCAQKEIRWFERSGHEMLVDCEAEAVLDAVEAFVLAHRPPAAAAPVQGVAPPASGA